MVTNETVKELIRLIKKSARVELAGKELDLFITQLDRFAPIFLEEDFKEDTQYPSKRVICTLTKVEGQRIPEVTLEPIDMEDRTALVALASTIMGNLLMELNILGGFNEK